jgi:hypothetical protein
MTKIKDEEGTGVIKGQKASPQWEGVHHLVGLAILKAG